MLLILEKTYVDGLLTQAFPFINKGLNIDGNLQGH